MLDDVAKSPAPPVSYNAPVGTRVLDSPPDSMLECVRRDLATAIDELAATAHSVIDHVAPVLISDPRSSEPTDARAYLSSSAGLRVFEDETQRVRELTNLLARLRGSIEV